MPGHLRAFMIPFVVVLVVCTTGCPREGQSPDHAGVAPNTSTYAESLAIYNGEREEAIRTFNDWKEANEYTAHQEARAQEFLRRFNPPALSSDSPPDFDKVLRKLGRPEAIKLADDLAEATKEEARLSDRHAAQGKRLKRASIIREAAYPEE